jgi:hypothetical protein
MGRRPVKVPVAEEELLSLKYTLKKFILAPLN